MVTQYPDVLIIPGQAGNSYKDEGGNFKTQPNSPDVQQPCRWEPSHVQKLIELPDGRKIAYSGIVQLPLSATTVKEGSNVEIKNRLDETVFKSQAIYFNRAQMHCKLYI